MTANGTSWQAVVRPNDSDSRLNAIDTLASGEAWAAGTDNSNSSASQTMIERYWVTRQVVQLPSVAVSASDPSAIVTLSQ